MANKGPKKGEVATTEVIVGNYGCCGSIWVGRYTKDPPNEIGKIGDDDVFFESPYRAPEERRMLFMRYTIVTGDTIYALRAETFNSRYAMKVWICTERVTPEDTVNDILRKVSPLYEGISLGGSSCKDLCKDLYNEFSSPTVTNNTIRRLYNLEGRLVGTVELIKLLV